MMSRLLVVFSVLVLLCHPAVQLAEAQDEKTCFTTGSRPATPIGLEVCSFYASRACCLSSYDQIIKSAYQDLIPGGPGCTAGAQGVYATLHDLLEYLCLPCNPDEPKYRFDSARGDVDDGGLVPPDPNAAPGDQTWRICESFLYGEPGSQQGIWGRNASQYDDCGVKLSSCRATSYFDIATQQLVEPPTDCKGEPELLIPSMHFADSPNPGLDLLLSVAQTLPGLHIVVVNDSDPNFSHSRTPCFGGRNGSAGPASVGALALGLFIVAILTSFTS